MENSTERPVGGGSDEAVAACIRAFVQRLRGIYAIPVNDGAGLLDGRDTFTRTFEMPPICGEAADLIEKMLPVIEAARCIRHWHDREPDGMVVSKSHVFALWESLGELDSGMHSLSDGAAAKVV